VNAPGPTRSDPRRSPCESDDELNGAMLLGSRACITNRHVQGSGLVGRYVLSAAHRTVIIDANQVGMGCETRASNASAALMAASAFANDAGEFCLP